MFNQPPSMPPVIPAGTAPSVTPSGASKAAKAGNNSSLIKTVVIIFLTFLLVGAGFLAYYFYNEYTVAKTDVDSQIAQAVVAREKEITDKLEKEFAEREKNPYRTFTGPSDYGSLSLKYPKTWSAYIDKDAVNGGDFEAYLHPAEVSPVSDKTINALRVTIESTSFESVTNRYKSLVEKNVLTASVISVGGVDATRYDGQLSNSLVGSVVIFKIRDKIVSLQTDAEIYREDFDNILKTVTFNQ